MPAAFIDTGRAEGPKGVGFFVYAISAAAALSGLLFGFDIAVINGAMVLMRDEFALTTAAVERAAGSLLVGCIIGAAAAGWLTDRFGRRRVIGVAALLFAASSVLAAIPTTIDQFIVARLIGGLGIGAASVLAPMYIAEVAPAGIRGRLVSFNQLAIVTGILLAYLVSWALAGYDSFGWRAMFAFALLPALALAVALIWTPESPRWLLQKGRRAEAMKVLTDTIGADEAEVEIAEIEANLAGPEAPWRALFEGNARPRILIGVALAILVQFTGINAVLFYGSVILKDQVGGFGDQGAIGANVLLGVVNLLATLVALPMIDRLGRKPMMVGSALAMAGAQLVLGWAFGVAAPQAWIVITCMLLATAAFAFGLGTCFWVLMSEIFPLRLRGRATSIAVLVLWAATLAVTVTFLSMTEAIGARGTFWSYAAMCALFAAVVAIWVPETKGKTLEELEALWDKPATP